MTTHIYHERAKILVKDYLKLEVELIDLLQKIESEKIFLPLGWNSMFTYCTQGLKLSESESYRFIGVSRKCSEIPKLKEAIQDGKINSSKSKKILSVITPANLESWIEKAMTLPTKDLEREVVKEAPEKKIQEKLKPVTSTRAELKLGMSLELEKKLKRCQELALKSGAKSLEEVLGVLVDHYLKTKDPVEKAKRNEEKTKVTVLGKVESKRNIPAQIKHQVMNRDEGKCQYRQPNGKPCGSRFFTEIHHLNPWSYGGKHELANLTTFCAAHHRFLHHQSDLPPKKFKNNFLREAREYELKHDSREGKC
jgi:5-methylcytosine-specific restriction endonuclease McrA